MLQDKTGDCSSLQPEFMPFGCYYEGRLECLERLLPEVNRNCHRGGPKAAQIRIFGDGDDKGEGVRHISFQSSDARIMIGVHGNRATPP